MDPVVPCTVAAVARAAPDSVMPIEEHGLEFSVYDEMVHRMPDSAKSVALARIVVGIAETAPTGDSVDAVIVSLGDFRVRVPWASTEEGLLYGSVAGTEPAMVIGAIDLNRVRLAEPARIVPDDADADLKRVVAAFEEDLCGCCQSFLEREDVCQFFTDIVGQSTEEELDAILFRFMGETDGKTFAEIYERHRPAIAEARAKLLDLAKLPASDADPCLFYRAATLIVELYDPAHLAPADQDCDPGDVSVATDFYASGLKDRVMALGHHEADVFKSRADRARESGPGTATSFEHNLTAEERYFIEQALPRIQAKLCRKYLYRGEPYLVVDTVLLAAKDRAVRPVDVLSVDHVLAGTAAAAAPPWPFTIEYVLSWTGLLSLFGMAAQDAEIGPRRLREQDLNQAPVKITMHENAPKSDTWSCATHAYPLVVRHEHEFTSMHSSTTPESVVRMARMRVPGWTKEKEEEDGPGEGASPPTITRTRDSHSLLMSAISSRNVIEDRIAAERS